MEEEQIFEEITTEGNPPQSPQVPQVPHSQEPQQSQGQQKDNNAQPQAAGIETSDNAIEEAEKHGQPSNTITERQRVHDKGYVERITEKTEKH